MSSVQDKEIKKSGAYQENFESPLEGFECPLAKKTMQDPVIASDGHSYERIEIENWFLKGKSESPVTGQKLSNFNLIPNRALKKSIADYLARRAKFNGLLDKLSKTHSGLEAELQQQKTLLMNLKNKSNEEKITLSSASLSSAAVQSVSASPIFGSSSSLFSRMPSSALEIKKETQISLQDAFIGACEQGDYVAVKAGLAKGAKPLEAGSTKKIPLYAAVWSMNLAVVDLLMKAKSPSNLSQVSWTECEKHNQEHYQGLTKNPVITLPM